MVEGARWEREVAIGERGKDSGRRNVREKRKGRVVRARKGTKVVGSKGERCYSGKPRMGRVRGG